MDNEPTRRKGCIEAGTAALLGGIGCALLTFVPPAITSMADQITPRITEYNEVTNSLLQISSVAAIPAFGVGVFGGIYLYAKSRRPPE